MLCCVYKSTLLELFRRRMVWRYYTGGRVKHTIVLPASDANRGTVVHIQYAIQTPHKTRHWWRIVPFATRRSHHHQWDTHQSGDTLALKESRGRSEESILARAPPGSQLQMHPHGRRTPTASRPQSASGWRLESSREDDSDGMFAFFRNFNNLQHFVDIVAVLQPITNEILSWQHFRAILVLGPTFYLPLKGCFPVAVHTTGSNFVPSRNANDTLVKGYYTFKYILL